MPCRLAEGAVKEAAPVCWRKRFYWLAFRSCADDLGGQAEPGKANGFSFKPQEASGNNRELGAGRAVRKHKGA
jgi:hypothetical protein